MAKNIIDTIYNQVKKSADYLRQNIGEDYLPKVLIVCGSGLGNLADNVCCPKPIKYSDIPEFPQASVAGHGSELIFGKLNEVQVACMKGRFHYYEGHSLQKTAMPVRVMKLLGAKYFIVTNAAGGLNENFNIGDLMLIKDHINWLGFGGQNPLSGPNDERFGIRFIPTIEAYDRELLERGKQIACYLGYGSFLREGVYTMVGGPNYESVAEHKCLRLCGADAVGMSTIPEVLTAVHCGMRVFGVTLITDKCQMSYDDDSVTSHEKVLEASQKRSKDLQELIKVFAGTLKC